tara:strand:- start:41 stop:454 length:414 start_codon:yes stop_codon:yes gene_type:complete
MGKLKWAKELAKNAVKAKSKKQKEVEKSKDLFYAVQTKIGRDLQKLGKQKDVSARNKVTAQMKKDAKNKKTLDKVKKMKGVSDETKLAAQREGGRRGQNRPEMKLKAHQARERAEKVLGIKKEPPGRLRDRQYLKDK